jgi:uncharacterized paraquat-inducible protein A
MSVTPDVLPQTDQEDCDETEHCSHCAKKINEVSLVGLSWFFAILAILLMYPSFCYPILSLEKLNDRKEATLLEGIIEMYRDDKIILAGFILVCSIIFPIVKNCSIAFLGTGSSLITPKLQRYLCAFVDFTGPWGKLEVVITAILLVFVNFGSETIKIGIEPALLPFSAMVVSSMAASWLYKN